MTLLEPRPLEPTEVDRVISVLREHTGHPPEQYKGLFWVEKTMRLEDIATDPIYNPSLGGREQMKAVGALFLSIHDGQPIKPLIVLYENHLLGHDYILHAALMQSDKEEVTVYYGNYPDKHVSWDPISKNWF
jgi:hypothetical protein